MKRRPILSRSFIRWLGKCGTMDELVCKELQLGLLVAYVLSLPSAFHFGKPFIHCKYGYYTSLWMRTGAREGEREREIEKWPAHHNEHITVYLCAGNWFVITKWLITISIGQKLCFSHSLHPFLFSMNLHLQSILHMHFRRCEFIWNILGRFIKKSNYSRSAVLVINGFAYYLHYSIIDFKNCHAFSFLMIYLTNCFDSIWNVIKEPILTGLMLFGLSNSTRIKLQQKNTRITLFVCACVCAYASLCVCV